MDQPLGERCHSRDVLNRLLSADVHQAVSALDDRTRRRLATALDLPRSMLTRGTSVATTIRHRIRRQPNDFAMIVAFFLTRDTHARLTEALDGHDADPTLEQLRDAVDAIIDDVGARLCALLLAVGADHEWPAAQQCRALLGSHDRLVLDALGPEYPDEASARPGAAKEQVTTDEVRERRAQRRRDRRQATQPQRRQLRYRRKPKPMESPIDADERLDPRPKAPK